MGDPPYWRGQCLRCGRDGHRQRDCTADLPRALDPPPLTVLFDPDGVLEVFRTAHPPTT